MEPESSWPDSRLPTRNILTGRAQGKNEKSDLVLDDIFIASAGGDTIIPLTKVTFSQLRLGNRVI